MTVHITYFVHGTTTDNEKGISSGWKNCGLSETGIAQSVELRHQIHEKFDAVFCSDLRRAVESARLTFKGKKILKDARLRECNYGAYNGKPSRMVESLQQKHIRVRFPKGESYENVRSRIAEFLAFLRKKYDGKHVAIVSSKAPQLALEVILGGKTWKEAFKEDWRLKGHEGWKPGWHYEVK